MDDLIPIANAADALGICTETARRWAADGRLAGAVRRGYRSHLFVPRSEVERLRRQDREDQERRARGNLINTTDAGRLLDMAATTVTKWARDGTLAGSVKDDDGRWLVRRAEVDRVLVEREAVLERRIARREAFQTAPRSRRRDEGQGT
jgi:predicted site-specific integrase-resolvase